MTAIDMEFIDSLEKQKEEFDLEEWAVRTKEDLLATDSVKCVLCGKEKSERDMQKIFARHEGICSRCFREDPDELE